MDYVELMEQARPRLGANCKGCLICNGRACGKKKKSLKNVVQS